MSTTPPSHPRADAAPAPAPAEAPPRKRTGLLITLGAGLVLLVVLAFTVGPILYRDLIVGPAASTPQEELSAQAGPGAGGDLELGAGEWVLGEGSFAGYRVAEVLNGTDVTVTGRTESVSGRITTSDTAVTAATIEVDVASIATDSSSRDSYFREQALDTATHPTASFVLDGTIAPDPVPGPGETIDLPVAGSLTLNGVTREMTAELTTALTDAGVTVAGQIPVTFADYGVTAPDLGFVRVEDQGFIEFSLTLVRAAG